MQELIQGTSVEFKGQALLILGRPGIGKTTLALKLIEQGAKLISDDITKISLQSNKLYCEIQEKLYGKIELRGLGIIQGIDVCHKAPLTCVIRLNDKEVERFPKEIQKMEFLGEKIPVFDFFACESTYLWVLYALKVLRGELSLLKE